MCVCVVIFAMAMLLSDFMSMGDGVAQSVYWLQTGQSGFGPWQRQKIFSLVSVSRPALKPTQPPIQWVPAVLPGLKRSRGVMLTIPLMPRSKMSKSCVSSPPLRVHGTAGQRNFTLLNFVSTCWLLLRDFWYYGILFMIMRVC
jgi:hypothetical protein